MIGRNPTNERSPSTGRRAAVAIAAGALIALVVQAARTVTATPPPPPRPPGVEATGCAECHAAAVASFDGGGHALLGRSLGADACTTCHEDLGDHATLETRESIRTTSTMDAAAIAEDCSRCHAGWPDHARAWESSPWAREGKTCLDCHGVHAPATGTLAIPVADDRLGAEGCRVCHRPRVTSMADTIHAGVVADGKVDACETCHGAGALHLRAVHIDPELVRQDHGIRAGADDAVCLECHDGARERHASRRSAWERPDLACSTCHAAHRPLAATVKGRGIGPVTTAADLAESGATGVGEAECARCHAASIDSFAGSPHQIALATDDRSCEACHGPASLHALGGSPRAILRPGTFDREGLASFCTGCHTDGPEHALAFDDSLHGRDGRTCASCHEVHAPAPADLEPALDAAVPAGTAMVGNARCATCHEDPHPTLDRSVHAPLATRAEGCESCHGPGERHVATSGRTDLIANPGSLDDRARDRWCMDCHDDTTATAAWNRHAHGNGEVGCADCHDPFAPDLALGLAAGEPELCARCHGEQTAQFRLPRHHRVPEGEMKCSDCHDLHRGSAPVRAATVMADRCAECHRAQSTPRLYPHVGDRHEGCAACHVPHGTTNPRLLRFRNTRDLCLSCHIPPPSHDVSFSGAHRRCTDCHIEVHGSDADRKLLR